MRPVGECPWKHIRTPGHTSQHGTSFCCCCLSRRGAAYHVGRLRQCRGHQDLYSAVQLNPAAGWRSQAPLCSPRWQAVKQAALGQPPLRRWSHLQKATGQALSLQGQTWHTLAMSNHSWLHIRRQSGLSSSLKGLLSQMSTVMSSKLSRLAALASRHDPPCSLGFRAAASVNRWLSHIQIT